MRPLLFLVLLVILVSWRENLHRNSSYLPLSIGNHWEFTDSLIKDGDYENVSWDIIGDTLINDTSYYVLRYYELSPKNVGYYRQKDGIVYERDNTSQKERLVIPPADSLGKRYDFTQDTIPGRMTLQTMDTTLKTPTKLYTDLLCLKYENLKTMKTYFYFFKKGIGLVGIIDSKGTYMRYLKSYHVK